MGQQLAKDDIKRYRDGYPDTGGLDDVQLRDNIQFYRNEKASVPNGDTIDNIHKFWANDFDKLERHHGYIQWLFPIHEKGMNYESQVLQRHEKVAMCADAAIRTRVLRSYELMLRFYGLRLVDQTTGEVGRHPKLWKTRFAHLNSSFHNYLRITRILKCLGEMTFERLKFPFLLAFLRELQGHTHLRNCQRSFEDYWVPTLRDNKERARMESLMRGDVALPPKPVASASSSPAVAANDDRSQPPSTTNGDDSQPPSTTNGDDSQPPSAAAPAQASLAAEGVGYPTPPGETTAPTPPGETTAPTPPGETTAPTPPVKPKRSIAASHILIKHCQSRDPISRRTGKSVVRSKASAVSALTELALTRETFAESAFARSDCSTFGDGGALGELGELEAAASALEVGEISGVVHTEAGVHIILRTA